MKIKQLLLSALLAAVPALGWALDHKGITVAGQPDGYFPIVKGGIPTAVVFDPADAKGISIAVENLKTDLGRVAGSQPGATTDLQGLDRAIVVGSIDNPVIKALAAKGHLDLAKLKGKREKYIMSVATGALPSGGDALVIAGSDRRGTIYGVYELCEQIGVSPWNWWADVPVIQQTDLSMAPGEYTAGEPAVAYRGIFLNDEAPCLTGWVKHTFGTGYGGKDFYAKVFELLLRLRGNYLWPAMWGWAFYADDPSNSDLADEMGIIMGTSHHEPMARNHQEWARKRKEYGAWDYATNQKVIDKFFAEGVRRIADKEDIITIGMRGDGDAPMGGEEGKDHEYKSRDQENLKLLRRIIDNQRKIIARETKRPAKEHPQLWALYKEVQKYYEMGLRVPDDVIVLLADDNWGNVRKLPDAEERRHPGGYGMYYHVDYVGAPRNSKWLNVTPIQNLWEQMTLAAEYGVDRLWVLNVGDLKPMEYPITLFLDLAWNPEKYTAATLLDHTRDFCAQQFGEAEADEAARIINLYSKYAGRVTPEMLDANTYTLEDGEWRSVRDDFLVLEAEALRQYTGLPEEYRDAYQQLVLFPVQAMANLYDMYYSQRMNRACAAAGNPDANMWAERMEKCFVRDSLLTDHYNNKMSGGKWCHFMDQKHIGYTSWHDGFPANKRPRVTNVAEGHGGYVFTPADGVVAIEAEHYNQAVDAPEAKWTVIPYMGRTKSGVTLMPRLPSAEGGQLKYTMKLSQEDLQGLDSVNVVVALKSTLPFSRPEGHRFNLQWEGSSEPVTVNYNSRLNENPENVYTVYYPTIARRVVTTTTTLPLPKTGANGEATLVISPIEPGLIVEKIVVDLGGYNPDSYLLMPESPMTRASR